MMDHHGRPANEFSARRALRRLTARAAGPDAEPAVIDAANVLTALWGAAERIGGSDAHIRHWLENSPDLARPRRILAGARCGRPGSRGRLGAADLAAFDHTKTARRTAVREIIVEALRAGTAS